MLQALRDFLSLRPRPQEGDVGPLADTNQALYITPGSLTFPGISIAAGAILNFITQNTDTNRLWVALVLAVIFGGFLLYLALSDPKADPAHRARATSIFVGVINTALLWITIFGISSI